MVLPFWSSRENSGAVSPILRLRADEDWEKEGVVMGTKALVDCTMKASEAMADMNFIFGVGIGWKIR